MGKTFIDRLWLDSNSKPILPPPTRPAPPIPDVKPSKATIPDHVIAAAERAAVSMEREDDFEEARAIRDLIKFARGTL